MKEKDFFLLDIENAYRIKLTDQTAMKSQFLSRHFYRKDSHGNIVALNLDGTNVTYLEALKPLKKLRTLSLQGNDLRDISLLSTFRQLETLDLYENDIEDLEPLKALHRLRSLNIDKNKVYDLSPLFDLLTRRTLRTLVCVDNPLQFPTVPVAKDGIAVILAWLSERVRIANQLIEENLKTKAPNLDLGRCGLTDLSLLPKLKECTHLTELILSNEWAEFGGTEWELITSSNSGAPNNLRHFPAELKALTSLKVLICGGDWKSRSEELRWNCWRITEMSVLSSFTQLEYLNLSNNNLSGTIGGAFPNLEYLHLNNNHITGIRQGSRFPKLKEVYLSNNELADGSVVRFFPNAETIDLHSNRISDLSPLKKRLQSIDIQNIKWKKGVLNIAQNPLTHPDMGVIEQGRDKVLAYFRRSEAEKLAHLKAARTRDIKLILVGNSNVGKSTLAGYLRTGKVKESPGSTHWMEIKPWYAYHNQKEFTIRIFDFGGQEYYHDTHHLFFTQQTAYVLLWDRFSNAFGATDPSLGGKGVSSNVTVQQYPLNYWLESIRYHANRRPVSADEARITEILEQRDREQAASDADDESYTITFTTSIPEARTVLGEEHPYVLLVQNKVDEPGTGELFDPAWIGTNNDMIFETTSMSLTKRRGLGHFKHLLFELFDRIPQPDQEILGSWVAIKQKIVDLPRSERKELSLAAFCDFCNVTISETPAAKALRPKEVVTLLFDELDTDSFAQYLSNIGMVLYFPKEPSLQGRVFLNQDAILKTIYDVLLGLTNFDGHFDLPYVAKRLHKPETDEECRNIVALMEHFKIIFPHPTSPNTYVAPLYLPKVPTKALELFLRSLKKPTYRFSFTGYIHKYVILDFFQVHGKDILAGRAAEEGAYYWRDGLVLSDKTSQEIVAVRFFNGSEDNGNARIDLFALPGSTQKAFIEQISDALEKITAPLKVEKEVTLDGIDFVPLSTLREAAEQQSWLFRYHHKNYHLVDFSPYLKLPGQMKKVFISYSKSDADYLVKLEKHLTVLKKNGTISTWNCRKLEAGEVWDDKIKSELEAAEIIIFLVSDDFLATDYIWDVEIKHAIERQAADPDNVKIVPIVVRACYWEESPLGKFTTAPGKAKVIGSGGNVDETFKEAVLAIKGIAST
jgi:internalin A